MSITKRIALVTGSAQGLGRSIALRLARDGFDIALNDVTSKQDQVSDVASEIEKMGQRTHVVLADVAVEEDVKNMIKYVVEGLGGLDVLVANAGISDVSPLVDMELDDWERVTTVNVRGTFLCYKYAAQQMIKQGRGGRIISACSVLGKMVLQGMGAYSASKFAIRALVQTAALELGSHNITVNAYAPGFVNTSMIGELMAKGTPEIVETWGAFTAMQPIKYEGLPDDVASIVGYLASKEAHFITGKSP